MEGSLERGKRFWLAGWWAGRSERDMADLLAEYVRPSACPMGDACVCAPGPDSAAIWN